MPERRWSYSDRRIFVRIQFTPIDRDVHQVQQQLARQLPGAALSPPSLSMTCTAMRTIGQLPLTMQFGKKSNFENRRSKLIIFYIKQDKNNHFKNIHTHKYIFQDQLKKLRLQNKQTDAQHWN